MIRRLVVNYRLVSGVVGSNPTESSFFQTKHIYIMKAIALLYVVFVFAILASWGVNLYKLTQCDFAPSWKGEILHGVGLIPAVSLVTVWSDAK